MAFAVVAGVDIPVTSNGARKIPQRIGSQTRAWSGAMHESTRTWKDRYEFRTLWVARSVANAIEAALQGPPPFSCTGDFFGATVSCYVSDIRGITDAMRFVDGDRVIFEFSLEEA